MGLAEAVTILFRDEHVLVASKPAGMLSVPMHGARGAPGAPEDSGVSLPAALKAQGIHVLPVHRLDREVSGAVLFALDETTRERLDAAFRERSVRKTYWAPL